MDGLNPRPTMGGPSQWAEAAAVWPCSFSLIELLSLLIFCASSRKDYNYSTASLVSGNEGERPSRILYHPLNKSAENVETADRDGTKPMKNTSISTFRRET